MASNLEKWVANQTKGDFKLPAGHRPYMVLAKGGTGPFSCTSCSFLRKKGDENHCATPLFKEFTGSTLLTDEKGDPLDDPSRACSDWFDPSG